MRDVKVYTTELCPSCESVQSLLEARGIPYEEIVLVDDSDEHEALAERTGMKSLPQVLVGGILVGGFRETVAADQTGMLADLLVD
ncbi:MAG: glutaredoxin [Actinomycetota bacterium]|nr:glutaredoxin [Actinomycetota bacterium]